MEKNCTKWAVYRGKIGLIAYMLVETLVDAECLLSYPVLKKDPERLPVIVNKMGGMTSFDPSVDSFVEIRTLSEDDEPLTLEERFPMNSAGFELGFISPEGETVCCSTGTYIDCAEAICERRYPGFSAVLSDQFLQCDQGWISVHTLDDELFVSYENLLTPQQIDVIQKLGIERFHPNTKHILSRMLKASKTAE